MGSLRNLTSQCRSNRRGFAKSSGATKPKSESNSNWAPHQLVTIPCRSRGNAPCRNRSVAPPFAARVRNGNPRRSKRLAATGSFGSEPQCPSGQTLHNIGVPPRDVHREATKPFRMDALIDRCIKRLLFVRGLKSMAIGTTSAAPDSLPRPSRTP
jgi:hypothetical protein